MTLLALGLVLASAFAHSTWNYLTKASRDSYAFTWAFTSVAGLLYLPFALLLAARQPPPSSVWFLGGVTVALHVAYFRRLNASYARADLSIVYPFARGTGLMLIPIGAVVLLGERVTTVGALSIGLILIGVLTLHTRGRGIGALRGLLTSLSEPGSRLAAMTGVVIAGYSLWDKTAVGQLNPVVLDTGIFLGQALINAPLVLANRREAVLYEVRKRPRAVLAAAILSPLAYLFVLTALTFSQVAYVAPTREIGIVIGTLLGARHLKEPYPRNRLVGVGLIVTGVFGLALLG